MKTKKVIKKLSKKVSKLEKKVSKLEKTEINVIVPEVTYEDSDIKTIPEIPIISNTPNDDEFVGDPES